MMNYFTALEYSTHSSVLEYVDYNFKVECIKFSLIYLFCGYIAYSLTFGKNCYQPFRIGASALLIFFHSCYFIITLYSLLWVSDIVITSDIYVMIMGLVSIIVNVSIAVSC